MIPYHMPGHKRNTEFEHISPTCALDFTEIDGLDDLRAPSGILADALERAALTYGAERTFFLVNGSTGGILSAIYALCRGRSVVMARNCHKSVYNAVCIAGCRPEYIMPRVSELGYFLDVTPAEVEEALLRTPDAAAVVLTSPTYEGVISDIRGISEICHAHGVPLIVDAAHGAHLGFLDGSVPSPVASGADAVIMSLHKTMPSLTQTALLHITGTLIDAEQIAASLAMFETSSPSYVLMASIDGCIELCRDRSLFDSWLRRIEQLERIGKARDIIERPTDVFAYDRSKIILRSPGMSGGMIADLLRREFHIEPEMSAASYIILMTGAGDTDRMTKELCRAFESFPESSSATATPFTQPPRLPLAVMTPAEATGCAREAVSLSDAVGRIAAEAVMAYPPGIPLIAPGELIDRETVRQLEEMNACGVRTVTSSGEFDGRITVTKRTNDGFRDELSEKH